MNEEMDEEMEMEVPREIDNMVALDELSKKRKELLKKQLHQFVISQRDKAVKHRASIGIEKVWDEDNEYYNGVDKFNSGVQFTKSGT